MENIILSTSELESIILRWMMQIGRKKPDAIGCNMPFTLESCDGPRREICFRLHTAPFMENPWGVTHGGMLALAADWAMGIASRALLNRNQTPTVSMQVDYLRPVPLNADLLLHVRLLHGGRTLARLRVDGVLAGDDRVCVTATGTYFLQNRSLMLEL